jgi:5'-nucleotidase
VAVAGTPADSVLYALDVDGVVPDLVVSGVNSGQDIGTFVPLSGTLGAARTAARREIPAIAVSAGNLEDSDHVTAAALARDEVLSRLDDVGAGENDEQVVVSLNVPTCPVGTAVRGVLDVAPAVTFPAGTNGLDLVLDCGSTAPASTATDDATAMGHRLRRSFDHPRRPLTGGRRPPATVRPGRHPDFPVPGHRTPAAPRTH